MSGTQGITGYRTLSEKEKELINEGKALGTQIEVYIDKLKDADRDVEIRMDLRWLAIGVTDLQKGLMAVIRAIARPTSF